MAGVAAQRTGIANLPFHYGKDGIHYPVDRVTYHRSIELLARVVNKSKLGLEEKREAIDRLLGKIYSGGIKS